MKMTCNEDAARGIDCHSVTHRMGGYVEQTIPTCVRTEAPGVSRAGNRAAATWSAKWTPGRDELLELGRAIPRAGAACSEAAVSSDRKLTEICQ
jgi:hypothetical protein